MAILSSPMTSVFTLDQKVRASSRCLPSVPRPAWPPPGLSFPSPSVGSEEKRALAKRLQVLIPRDTWVGGTTFPVHDSIGADGCSQATAFRWRRNRLGSGKTLAQDHAGNQRDSNSHPKCLGPGPGCSPSVWLSVSQEYQILPAYAVPLLLPYFLP